MLFPFSATSIISGVGCCGAVKSNSDRSEISQGGPAAGALFRNEVSAVAPVRHQPVGRAVRDNREPDEKVRLYSALLLDEFFAPPAHCGLRAVVATAYEKSAEFQRLFMDWGDSQPASATRLAVPHARHVAANRKACHDSLPNGVPAPVRESSSELEQQLRRAPRVCRPAVKELIEAMLLQPNETAAKEREIIDKVQKHTELVLQQMQGLTPAGTRSATANSPDSRRYPGRAFLQGEVASVRQHSSATNVGSFARPPRSVGGTPESVGDDGREPQMAARLSGSVIEYRLSTEAPRRDCA
jgi:hypothetical protein